MIGKDLQSRFELEQRQIFVHRLEIALCYMAIPLVMSFSLIDYFFKPELLAHFFLIRLLVVPVSFTCIIMYKFKYFSEKHYTIPGYFFSLFLGILNSYMSLKTGGDRSPYYAGLNLVGIGAISFMPWSLRQIGINAMMVYAPYFLFILLSSEPITLSYIVPNSAFMLSTMFLSGIICEIFKRLRLEELKTRILLEEENRTKADIIDKKTKEGVFLQKLTTQFSPQVVNAIKCGDIAISEKLRREVTCIFIDVENSTQRSNRIDYNNYTAVLSDFFSACVEELLKNDVTVGTYLGDGMLAFTNAPQQNPNHRDTALKACMDIIRLHSRRFNYYTEKWRTQFNVRIGINSGYVHVGFFPNITHGTYTVVGDVVNLTSRLCARAGHNQICVTKSFLSTISKEVLADVKVVAHEKCDEIKGFEGESFDLFSVGCSIDHGINASDMCPLCSKQLTVQADMGGAVMLKCYTCGFVDIVDQEDVGTQTKKAA